jgi:hypothetical protein
MSAFRRKPRIEVAPIELRDVKPRCVISPAKVPLLEATKRVIADLEDFLPVTVRQIFYQLLNDPPLIHASKLESRFSNDQRSYRALKDLLTRARHEGYISYEAIDDPTRRDVMWDVHRDLVSYYREKQESLLKDYWRDLMQSQPNHIQIIVEKNTLDGVVRPVAMKYRIPYQIGRGQNTTTPLWKIASRFKQSARGRLIILALSDLDPDGDAIAHSLGQRLRDDHGIVEVEVFKVALTMDQIRDPGLRLSKSFVEAKKDSPNYQRYFERYETNDIWELESVPPRTLQALLTRTIDAVIDRKAFNTEVAQERLDDPHNAAVRAVMLKTLEQQFEA